MYVAPAANFIAGGDNRYPTRSAPRDCPGQQWNWPPAQHTQLCL